MHGKPCNDSTKGTKSTGKQGNLMVCKADETASMKYSIFERKKEQETKKIKDTHMSSTKSNSRNLRTITPFAKERKGKRLHEDRS